MKINRVIRFQEDSVKEKIKQKISNQPEKDINPNEDILVEEHYQGIEADDGETISYIDSNNDASGELRKCVERVVAGRKTSNMIGVFGMNSDIIVNNLCRNLQEIRGNTIFVGKVEGFMTLSDVYNGIAAIFFNYLKSNYDRQYDMSYYIREAMGKLQEVYNDNYQTHNEYLDSMSALDNMVRITKRDKNLLAAINQIKQITSSLSNLRDYETKFLITVEIEKFDHKVLNMLSKLDSSDLIIIVFTMFDFNLAKEALRNSIGNVDCMDKFFYPGNLVIA